MISELHFFQIWFENRIFFLNNSNKIHSMIKYFKKSCFISAYTKAHKWGYSA